MRLLINGYLCSPCSQNMGVRDKLKTVYKEDLINSYLYCSAAGCDNASDYCDYEGNFYEYLVYKDVEGLTEDF